MSELKHQLMLNKDMSWVPCYLKSEADAYIRKLKYKRCLAMAEWCNSEMVVETFASFRTRRTKEVWREEHKYFAKWRKIWFELAMKFKEVRNV